MASLRQIKRDIDYLVNEVVTDAYLAYYLNSGKQDDIVVIMKEAVELRNEFFNRANNPQDKHDAKGVKAHFKSLRQDMFAKIDGLLTKLSEIIK